MKRKLLLTLLILELILTFILPVIKKKTETLCKLEHKNIPKSKRDLSKNEKNITYAVLWTQIRSGSRFTGRILSFNFDLFYTEEPIRELFESGGEKENMNLTKFVSDILNCRFSLYPNYLKMRQNFLHYHTKDSQAIFYNFLKDSNLTVDYEEALCKFSKFRLTRIVISSFDVLQPLLEDNKINFRVIFLVRDPRAIFKSRRQVIATYGVNPILSYDPCEKLEKDIALTRKLDKITHSKLVNFYM